MYNGLLGLQKMPYIVIIIDEFSDLMAYNSKEVDDIVRKLAMMARAVGIHLVISTSRVGKDVYPEVTSALMQTHIAFNTFDSEASKRLVGRYKWSEWADAKILLGHGDMYFEGLAALYLRGLRFPRRIVVLALASSGTSFLVRRNAFGCCDLRGRWWNTIRRRLR